MNTPIPTAVPIHHGSRRFHELEIGGLRITEAQFCSGSRIPPHYHERPTLAVMLGGSFILSMGSRDVACEPGAVLVEPAGDSHCNCMGCRGAWVVAVQPDPEHPELKGAFEGRGAMLASPSTARNPHAAYLARRIVQERRANDAFSSLMIQALALELLAVAARAGANGAAPDWLQRVEQRLRDSVPHGIAISHLAQEAGVHGAHLARQFRRRHGQSLGSFVLQRRLEWAASELVNSGRPIAGIALDAGFSDQSHFTKRFRQYLGVTPGCFRAHRSTDREAGGA